MVRQKPRTPILTDKQMSRVTHFTNRGRLPFVSSKLPKDLVEYLTLVSEAGGEALLYQ